MDQLKERIAKAALDGAVTGIFGTLGRADYHIEVVQKERLLYQLRVRRQDRSGAPRYFIVRVSEAI
jgi:hypothetical protein